MGEKKISLDDLDNNELETLAELIDERIRRSREQEEEESESNTNFIQLYRDGIKPVRQLIRVNPTAAEIFHFFLEHMDWGNSVACSSTVLEEVTGKSRSSVTRAIKELKTRKFIEVSKMGSTNVYHLNAKVVWSTWASSKRYAKFSATVILAESEQEEPQVGGGLTKLVEVRKNEED